MIIGACGYGATGSSAVYDLIREFEGIQSLPLTLSLFIVIKLMVCKICNII